MWAAQAVEASLKGYERQTGWANGLNLEVDMPDSGVIHQYTKVFSSPTRSLTALKHVGTLANQSSIYRFEQDA